MICDDKQTKQKQSVRNVPRIFQNCNVGRLESLDLLPLLQRIFSQDENNKTIYT